MNSLKSLQEAQVSWFLWANSIAGSSLIWDPAFLEGVCFPDNEVFLAPLWLYLENTVTAKKSKINYLNSLSLFLSVNFYVSAYIAAERRLLLAGSCSAELKN